MVMSRSDLCNELHKLVGHTDDDCLVCEIARILLSAEEEILSLREQLRLAEEERDDLLWHCRCTFR